MPGSSAKKRKHSSMTILDFLRHWADHNWSTKKERRPCTYSDYPELQPCDVCQYDLVQWTDREEQIFFIRWYDDRSNEPNSPFLFQMYGVQVSRDWGSEEDYKRRMKSNVRKQIENGSLVPQDERKAVSVKRYQFATCNTSHQMPREETPSSSNGDFASLMTFDDNGPMGPERTSHAADMVANTQQFYRSPLSSEMDESFTSSTPPTWEYLPGSSSSGGNSSESNTLQAPLQHATRSEVLAQGVVPSSNDDENYVGIEADFNRMELVPPSTTAGRFHKFMNEPEQYPSINDDDVEALSTHFSRFPLSRFERDVKEMRVIFCYKADDSGLPTSQIIAVDDSSSQGFRLVSEEAQLEGIHSLGKYGPHWYPVYKLPSPANVTRVDVKKCMKTFEDAGVVFLWKSYPVPSSVGHIPYVDSLCWRLFCYRICKGYPAEYLSSLSASSSEYSQDSHRLEMCMKVPLVKTAEKLERLEFIQVLDLLEVCALAIQRGSSAVRSAQKEQLRSEMRIHVGLKSGKSFDMRSVPAKLELENTFVTQVFDSSTRARGGNSGGEVPDNSDSRTQVTAATSITFDSNRGH